MDSNHAVLSALRSVITSVYPQFPPTTSDESLGFGLGSNMRVLLGTILQGTQGVKVSLGWVEKGRLINLVRR